MLKIEKPKTDKEGLINALKIMHNAATSGDVREVMFQLDDLIDSLSSERVTFNWGTVTDIEEDSRRMVAAFCAENPGMVD